MLKFMVLLKYVVVFFFISACAPMVYDPPTLTTEPEILKTVFKTADGSPLPFKQWIAKSSQPKAIILAVHGFNDYSNFIDDAATYFSIQNITTYAYDQRGFGRAPGRGLWAGETVLLSDVQIISQLIQQRHPGIPLYLLGESMGGAVVMAAMASNNPPKVDGVILSAPAIWGRKTMPWYQRTALWIGAHTVPWMTLTGQGLKIMPSDNIEMLIALGRDPKIITKTRIDTMYGLVNLMDQALESAPDITAPTLILYGMEDQIIPKKPTRLMLKTLAPMPPDQRRIAVYKNGYHMLLRDLQAETVWRDIDFWISVKDQALPSGAELNVDTFIKEY